MDGIIAALSVHTGLRVISRLSTSPSRRPDVRLPDIRSLLGASYVVFGQCTVTKSARARPALRSATGSWPAARIVSAGT